MKNVFKFLTLTLLVGALLTSCNNDDDNTPEENIEAPTPTSTYYLLGIFDDEPLLVESTNASSSEDYPACGVQTAAHGGAWLDIDLTTFDQTLHAKAYIHISDDGLNELDIKYEAYKVGVKEFFDCNSGVVDGGEIVYIDENEVSWSSNGSQDADAYFEILERNGTWTGDFFTATPTFVVKAKFSCRLYDAAGNSKLITNGEFNSLFNFIQ